jgi:hypothetical protein
MTLQAYGVAVMLVIWTTTVLASIVLAVCYDINPLWLAPFTLGFGACTHAAPPHARLAVGRDLPHQRRLDIKQLTMTPNATL